MQLTVMPGQRRDAQQLRMIRGRVAAHRRIGQHPGIHAMRFPHLHQLLAGFLETQLLSECLGLVALFRLHAGQLARVRDRTTACRLPAGKSCGPTVAFPWCGP